MLDPVRVGAVKLAPVHILAHPGDGLRPEGRRLALPNAGDAVIRGQLHEDEIASALARRRIADNEDLATCKFHNSSNSLAVGADHDDVPNTFAPTRGVHRLVDLIEGTKQTAPALIIQRSDTFTKFRNGSSEVSFFFSL